MIKVWEVSGAEAIKTSTNTCVPIKLSINLDKSKLLGTMLPRSLHTCTYFFLFPPNFETTTESWGYSTHCNRLIDWNKLNQRWRKPSRHKHTYTFERAMILGTLPSKYSGKARKSFFGILLFYFCHVHLKSALQTSYCNKLQKAQIFVC